MVLILCNADLNYCLLRAKPLWLTPDQHAQVNRLYELSLAKSNHNISIDPTKSLILLLLMICYICIYIYIFIVQCIPLCV